ncbi:WhiB family transcriptional regulator [Blastococcus sp. CT_GayMR20]|nr:WhiB family transcriptional regulator [Blastococcus sp. CT_GayMR20]
MHRAVPPEELPVSSFSRPFLTLLTDSSATPAPEPVPASFDAFAAAADGWRLDALCAETDPEAFFPEKGGSTREAKRVCTGCDVRAECLEYALANDERFGIWGGLSERERRRLRLMRRETLSA